MPGMMPNMMAGGMQGFDPKALSEYFQQSGWGNWNPMMMMNPAMMAMPMMGGMDPSAMGGAAGGSSPYAPQGGQGGGYRGGRGGGGGNNAFGQPRQSPFGPNSGVPPNGAPVSTYWQHSL